MQIDADPEEGIAEDSQQQQAEADFIVENPTLVSILLCHLADADTDLYNCDLQ